MVVIVSPGKNEIELIESSGVDIVPHRKRMNEEKLGEKFKDPSDPFGLALGRWFLGHVRYQRLTHDNSSGSWLFANIFASTSTEIHC